MPFCQFKISLHGCYRSNHVNTSAKVLKMPAELCVFSGQITQLITMTLSNRICDESGCTFLAQIELLSTCLCHKCAEYRRDKLEPHQNFSKYDEVWRVLGAAKIIFNGCSDMFVLWLKVPTIFHMLTSFPTVTQSIYNIIVKCALTVRTCVSWTKNGNVWNKTVTTKNNLIYRPLLPTLAVSMLRIWCSFRNEGITLN